MPSARQTARLHADYRNVMVGLKEADTRTRRDVRAELRHAGDKVREGATQRFDQYDPRSAQGYRVRVRQRGVAVEQSIRRTTGKHPEFGTLQMQRALVPSLEANEDETYRRFEEAVDKSTLIFNGGL
jgi:hypothetical protein